MWTYSALGKAAAVLVVREDPSRDGARMAPQEEARGDRRPNDGEVPMSSATVAVGGFALGIVLGMLLLWARRRMPHSWEHALMINRVYGERRILPSGCEYVCAVCETCGKAKPIAHSLYCDGCGREPR